MLSPGHQFDVGEDPGGVSIFLLGGCDGPGHLVFALVLVSLFCYPGLAPSGGGWFAGGLEVAYLLIADGLHLVEAYKGRLSWPALSLSPWTADCLLLVSGLTAMLNKIIV